MIREKRILTRRIERSRSSTKKKRKSRSVMILMRSYVHTRWSETNASLIQEDVRMGGTRDNEIEYKDKVFLISTKCFSTIINLLIKESIFDRREFNVILS